jgi:hypothetical protein
LFAYFVIELMSLYENSLRSIMLSPMLRA